MYLYLELWNPTDAWLALSEDERNDYMEQVGPSIGQLTDAGVELIGFAMNDEDTPHRAAYRYLAAWTMPGREQVDLLEGILDEAGWHDYFEQVNGRGTLVAPEAALADMTQLNTPHST